MNNFGASCFRCIYYDTSKKGFKICVRFPKVVAKNQDNWCGEFIDNVTHENIKILMSKGRIKND